MDISGWEIDLRALYGRTWRRRARFNLREWLWESPDGAFAVLFFAIGEVGMNKQVGRIAVFRDKHEAKLVLAPKGLFWCEGCSGDPVCYEAATGLALVWELRRRWWSLSLGSRRRGIDLGGARLLPSVPCFTTS